MHKGIGIIIQARMGSSRLPGKVLLKLNGKSVLGHVVERCLKLEIGEVIVATTNNKNDDVIYNYCKDNNIKCFRGSENNVLNRYYKCAVKFKLKYIIRATADNPLIDKDIVNKLVDEYFERNLDYSRVDTATFPKGFDCEIFNYKSLEYCIRAASRKEEKEHVTIYLRKHPEIFNIGQLSHESDLSSIRLTLDTEEDFKLIKNIYNNIKVPTFKNVLAYLKKNPHLIKINKHIIQREDFNQGKYRLIKTEYGYWKVDPPPKKKFLKKYYEYNYSDKLEKVNIEDKAETLESFVKHRSVLDIGCGDGSILKVFKKRGWSVSGIEPSISLRGNNDLNIINKDFNDIKHFKKVDAVILNFVLEHLTDPVVTLKKIKNKVLKKNGIIMIEVPNDFNELQLASELSCDTGKYWIKIPDHLNYFSFKSMSNLLEKLGFKIVYKESSFPLELFILMGENYIKNKNLGSIIHNKRMLFENNLINSGRNKLKRKFYEKMAELELGRSVIMYAMVKNNYGSKVN